MKNMERGNSSGTRLRTREKLVKGGQGRGRSQRAKISEFPGEGEKTRKKPRIPSGKQKPEKRRTSKEDSQKGETRARVK